MLDLIDRQNARQHGAADAKQLLHHIDGFIIGRRTLHRHVQPQIRMTLGGISHNRRVGDDYRVRPQLHRRIDSPMPPLDLPRLGKSIDCHQHIAAARMGVSYPFLRRFHIEIQSRKIARIRRIFQPHINCVSAIVHRRLQSRQITGRTNQLRDFRHFAFLNSCSLLFENQYLI